MSGVESLVYGSSGSGGAKLPSNLLHLSGTIRDEVVDWGAGATAVVVWEATVASTAIASDTQICEGLYATPTGLSWTDGTNPAVYVCAWDAGDVLVIVLTTTAGGKMKLGMLIEQVIDILSNRYLHTENYTNLDNYA